MSDIKSKDSFSNKGQDWEDEGRNRGPAADEHEMMGHSKGTCDYDLQLTHLSSCP